MPFALDWDSPRMDVAELNTEQQYFMRKMCAEIKKNGKILIDSKQYLVADWE